MKLYMKPGACSLSPHIALREAGLPFELVKVDTKAGLTATGADFRALNPKGYVPALEIEPGAVLTEGPAIVQFIADRAPEKKLAPVSGTLERARLQEWLNYIGTELHKGAYSPLFNSKAPPEWRTTVREGLTPKLAWLDAQLAERPFITGDTFTVADAYLFTVLRWSPYVGVPLEQYPSISAYIARVEARPAVQDALKAEAALRA